MGNLVRSFLYAVIVGASVYFITDAFKQNVNNMNVVSDTAKKSFESISKSLEESFKSNENSYIINFDTVENDDNKKIEINVVKTKQVIDNVDKEKILEEIENEIQNVELLNQVRAVINTFSDKMKILKGAKFWVILDLKNNKLAVVNFVDNIVESVNFRKEADGSIYATVRDKKGNYYLIRVYDTFNKFAVIYGKLRTVDYGRAYYLYYFATTTQYGHLMGRWEYDRVRIDDFKGFTELQADYKFHVVANNVEYTKSAKNNIAQFNAKVNSLVYAINLKNVDNVNANKLIVYGSIIDDNGNKFKDVVLSCNVDSKNINKLVKASKETALKKESNTNYITIELLLNKSVTINSNNCEIISFDTVEKSLKQQFDDLKNNLFTSIIYYTTLLGTLNELYNFLFNINADLNKTNIVTFDKNDKVILVAQSNDFKFYADNIIANNLCVESFENLKFETYDTVTVLRTRNDCYKKVVYANNLIQVEK